MTEEQSNGGPIGDRTRFLGLPNLWDVLSCFKLWILPLPAHTIPLAKEDGY